LETIREGITVTREELCNQVGVIPEVQLARLAGRIDSFEAILDMEIPDGN
jgi:hypothetical protein